MQSSALSFERFYGTNPMNLFNQEVILTIFISWLIFIDLQQFSSGRSMERPYDNYSFECVVHQSAKAL